MAKIVKVGYGVSNPNTGHTDGGYSYVVNDNVRVGQVIQVVATHTDKYGKRGKKFVTSATTQHSYKENSVMGQDARAEAGGELTEAYTGKELGATGSKVKPAESEIKGLKPQSNYTMSARAESMKRYNEQHIQPQWTEHAQETFDMYSKKFMGKGEQ